MLKQLKNFYHREKGAAFVETAITLPIIILMIASVFEVGMYILLQSKLTRMAGVVTDAITRQALSRTALIGIMDSAYTAAHPFDFSKYGQMVVTQIRNTSSKSDPSKMIISWQQAKNGGMSQLGAPGSVPKNLPGGVSVVNEQTMVVTEIFYQYSPLLFKGYMPVKSIYLTAVFVPRSGDMNSLLTG
ncbi:MAG: pilus assembly protein [Candidatus Paracaedibacteraceae bacterium]|nr:pilus assembly protein [Candidatus Paracaedibacteraceae bacterium]